MPINCSKPDGRETYQSQGSRILHPYAAAVGEEPVIPEYDYTDVSATLKEIDRKTVIIKHA